MRCLECGAPALEDFDDITQAYIKLCERCYAKDKGLCTECGKEPSDPKFEVFGDELCESCYDKAGYCHCDTCLGSGSACMHDCDDEYCQGCIERAMDRDFDMDR